MGSCLWTLGKTFQRDGSLKALAVETGNESLFLGSSGFNEVSWSTSREETCQGESGWLEDFI
jgi:hypothetical protein